MLLQQNHTGQSTTGRATVADREPYRGLFLKRTPANPGLSLHSQDQMKGDIELSRTVDFTRATILTIRHISSRILVNNHLCGMSTRKNLGKQTCPDFLSLPHLPTRSSKTIYNQSRTILLSQHTPRRHISHLHKLGNNHIRSKVRGTPTRGSKHCSRLLQNSSLTCLATLITRQKAKMAPQGKAQFLVRAWLNGLSWAATLISRGTDMKIPADHRQINLPRLNFLLGA